jgi:hypothetical protein
MSTTVNTQAADTGAAVADRKAIPAGTQPAAGTTVTLVGEIKTG